MNKIVLIVMLTLLTNFAFGQKEKNSFIKNENSKVIQPIEKDSLSQKLSEKNEIFEIKNQLFEKYKKSDKYKIKELKPINEKQILNVGWFDTQFNEVTATMKGELISIAVLTKGYQIGDKIEITIDSEEGESLMEGEKCNEITFIGKVNFENFAFLKNIFFVEGEKEQIVISKEWKDKYICK